LKAVIVIYKNIIDFSHIYKDFRLPFKNREIIIKYIKIPTFRIGDRRKYYVVFLVDLYPAFFYKTEIKQIARQCWEVIDNQDIDSFTIFLFAKSKDFLEPNNPYIQNNKVFILNSSHFSMRHEHLVFQHICKFLQRRIEAIRQSKVVFGEMLEDCTNIEKLLDNLHKEYTVNCITYNNIKRNIKRNSYNNSFNIKRYINNCYTCKGGDGDDL